MAQRPKVERDQPRKLPSFSEVFLSENRRVLPSVLPDGKITRDWALGSGSGDGIRVAVIDTGVDATHRAIGSVQGYADVSDTGGSVTISTETHEDLYGHGTACAGIVRSMAPSCEIYSVRVLGKSLFGTGLALLKGIEWAVQNGCQVCNLSLGTTQHEYFAALHRVADDAYFKNTIMVVAANNMPVATFPASFASVISVASHSEGNPEILLYNASPPVEFGAHGMNVRVPWSGGGFMKVTGNSYAAPHVTGFVARLLSEHPNLTPPEVKAVLKAIADNTGTPGPA